MLVSRAFENKLLVFVHCLLHGAHFCRSTNFNANEYFAVWFNTTPPLKLPDVEVGPSLMAVDVGTLRGSNPAAPVCRLEMDDSNYDYLNTFALLKSTDLGRLSRVRHHGRLRAHRDHREYCLLPFSLRLLFSFPSTVRCQPISPDIS